MARLKDRNKFIPNGFTFYQPETGWRPPRMASFETIVQGIIAHRNANPWLKEKNGWPTDIEAVRNELDVYNAKVCAQMGWDAFIVGGPDSSPPLTQPPQQTLLQRSRNVAAGAETIVDHIRSREEAVPAEQSAARALVCTTCDFNSKGDLLSFFTRAAAEAIRKAIQFSRDIKLETPHDEKLGTCDRCDCPLKLKVHFPIERITAHMKPEVRDRLPEYCWIVKESK